MAKLSKTYKLFIFDFDGTLGDTKECVVSSFQQTLLKNNLPVADREQIIHYMGLSLKQVFEKLTKIPANESFYDQLVTDYRTFYRDFLTKKTLIFPEVAKTLKEMKTKNVFCSIATSKKTEFAMLSCKFLKIDNYFDLYIGDDKVSQKKPHPEMLLHTLDKLKIDKAEAVMIGDSTFDIEMGNAINMDTIAVTWGVHSENLLRLSKPTLVIHKFSDLLHFV